MTRFHNSSQAGSIDASIAPQILSNSQPVTLTVGFLSAFSTIVRFSLATRRARELDMRGSLAGADFRAGIDHRGCPGSRYTSPAVHWPNFSVIPQPAPTARNARD